MKIAKIFFFIMLLLAFAGAIKAGQCSNGVSLDIRSNGAVWVKGLNYDPSHVTEFSSANQANQVLTTLKKLGFFYSQCATNIDYGHIETDPSKIIIPFQGLNAYNANAYSGEESDKINVYAETYYYDAPGSALLAGSAWPMIRGQKMKVWFKYWPKDEPETFWETAKQDKIGQASFTQNIFLFKDSIYCFTAFAQKYDGDNPVGDPYPAEEEMCFAPPSKLPPVVVSESGNFNALQNRAYFQASVWAKAGETNYQVWFEYWEEGNKNNTIAETPHFTKNGNGYFDAIVSVNGSKKYCFQPFAMKTAGSYAGFGPERCFSDKSWRVSPVVGTEAFNYTFIKNDKRIKAVISGKIYKTETPNDLFKAWFLFYPKGRPDKPIGALKGGIKQDVYANKLFTFQYEVNAGQSYCFVPYAQRAQGGQPGYGREICFPEDSPTVITESYDYAASFKRAVIKAHINQGTSNEYIYYFKYYPYGKESLAISTKQKTKKGEGIVTATLENIPNNKIYCFLPFARNKNGYAWAKGSQLCFPSIPIVVTKDPENITARGATLKGLAVNQYNVAGSYYTQFQFWERGTYKRNLTDFVSWGKSQSQAQMSNSISLSPNKGYCYRSIVRIYFNGLNYENYGQTKCFKTKAEDPSVCSSESISTNPSIDQTLRVIRFVNSQTDRKVRESLTFAMLIQESQLGQDFGGCCYQYSANCCYSYPTSDMWGTKDQKQVFQDICAIVGKNWMTTKVSCPSYGKPDTCEDRTDNGGAMGIAQFMPVTWMGHVDDVKIITKHQHSPSPWNLCDSIAANIAKLYSNGARADGNGESGAIGAYNPGNASYLYQVTQRRCWCAKYIAGDRSYKVTQNCFYARKNIEDCSS